MQPHRQPARRRLSQKLVSGQASVPGATVRVQNSKLRGSTRRPKPVARNADLCPLAHHVTPEPDPGPTVQLQPQSGLLGQRAQERGRQTRRLQDKHLDTRPTSHRGQPVDPFGQTSRGDSRRIQGLVRQIEQQQIDRSILE
jgi:hypothetical protein